MNEETKLILENQAIILRALYFLNEDINVSSDITEQRRKTLQALKPKDSDTTQKIKDALSDGKIHVCGECGSEMSPEQGCVSCKEAKKK